MKYVRKHCNGTMGTKATGLLRFVYAVAFATTEDVSCLCAWRGTG